MSKKNLAFLIFGLAFGVNIIAFLFAKKSFQVEEVKNVWLYELPITASPLDAYVSSDLGPHQGVVGTLFQPDSLVLSHPDAPRPITNLLANSWTWDAKTNTLTVQLKKDATFSNKDPITPWDWVLSHQYLSSVAPAFKSSPIWQAWKTAVYEATSNGLRIKVMKPGEDFDLERFLSEVLTHPLSGVIHANNITAMKSGKALEKDWISSGPYSIRKWNPKEIEMVSRVDFPDGMRKDFFRTLKFQSAPVKNPACDFLVGRNSDASTFKEQVAEDTDSTLHIFWICRSFKQEAFCKDPKNREILSKLLSGELKPEANLLKGKQLKYRIPTGSDDFRNEIRTRIQSLVELSGGQVSETSYFFESSQKTDIELEFVVTPRMKNSTDFATSLALMSSRLGEGAANAPWLVGEIANFPIQIYTKMKKEPVYPDVFLNPDLDEKKLPL